MLGARVQNTVASVTAWDLCTSAFNPFTGSDKCYAYYLGLKSLLLLPCYSTAISAFVIVPNVTERHQSYTHIE